MKWARGKRCTTFVSFNWTLYWQIRVEKNTAKTAKTLFVVVDMYVENGVGFDITHTHTHISVNNEWLLTVIITDFSGFFSVLSFFVLSATVIVIFSNKLFGFYLFSSLNAVFIEISTTNKTKMNFNAKNNLIVNTLAYFRSIIGFDCGTFSCSEEHIISNQFVNSRTTLLTSDDRFVWKYSTSNHQINRRNIA